MVENIDFGPCRCFALRGRRSERSEDLLTALNLTSAMLHICSPLNDDDSTKLS